MTITDAIDRADDIAPNQYTTAQKTQWLRDFDGKVLREVILTHEPDYKMPPGWDADTGTELLIPEPYAADIYVNYLLSRVAEANAEIQKYNVYSTLLNSEYRQWADFFNRTHTPKQERRWRF